MKLSILISGLALAVAVEGKVRGKNEKRVSLTIVAAIVGIGIFYVFVL